VWTSILHKGGENLSSFIVEVWGDFACFTRPEAKVERLSYPVMTPSAARGIMDAIYAKPKEFSWRISKIEILKPIQYITLRRNEVKEKISQRAVLTAARRGLGLDPVIVDATRDLYGTDAKGRTQRQMIALKDVHYRIHSYIKPRVSGKLKALESQAERRIKGGKCFYQPYLGCREFSAYFSPPKGNSFPGPEKINMDIGWMLYDVFNLDEVVIGTAAPFVSLFRAQIKNGVLNVPAWESDEVRKPQ